MRILAFLEDPPVVQKILLHIGEPIEAAEVLPALGQPQRELEFDQVDSPEHAGDAWPETDQAAGESVTWE